MASNRDLLLMICVKVLKDKGLYDDKHQARLKAEIREIDNQAEHDYFLDLVRKKQRFPKNDNNLLVPYLLGLCSDFDINKPPVTIQGEFPDIDVDYLPEVRDHLKKDWAPKTFGEDKVCSIGNYMTFGPKLALTDMARVHNLDSKEIKAITTKMGLKDEDGDTLTIDAAIELFPELKAYAEAHPEVIAAAKRLVGRNRGMGKHAGGLIVSAVPIADMVPMVVDKEGNYVSAFTEGLHSQDLGPIGFVKFDLLVVDGLLAIYECCKLIKERHGIQSICAKPGQPDWSDTSYLNDIKALAMANGGRLKCVFQFDSDGIRKMVKEGGVASFDDLAAYSALYRPGPMQSDMHNTYIKRKNGKEEYHLHPVLKPILGTTYGVQVYQEQVMQLLNKVGGVSPAQTEKTRKAISKKDEKTFKKVGPQFIQHGMETLGWFEKQVEELWEQLKQFAAYGFNKSHAYAYTYISARLLWLKTHYPIEFFTAKLRCEQDSDKIKEYKLEAQRCGVKVMPLDINKSNLTFDIVDDAIYLGFSNVKGVGEDAAARIVENKPYNSFEEFLAKVGTNANIVKPLIGLSVFKEADRATLHEFYEHFKDQMKKREDRDKRAAKSRQEIVDQFRYLLPKDDQGRAESLIQELSSDEPKATAVYADSIMGDVDQLYKLVKKYRKNVEALKAKQSDDGAITFGDFKPKGEIEAELKELYNSLPQKAELQYYGFGWDHILEYSPDYEGDMTFDRFENDNTVTAPIECQIVKKPERKVAKNGKTVYYTTRVEDANGKQVPVTIWDEDFQRFADILNQWDEGRGSGPLVRMKLERPGPGFGSYTLDSPPKQMRHKVLPKDPKQDWRVIPMAWPDDKAAKKTPEDKWANEVV